MNDSTNDNTTMKQTVHFTLGENAGQLLTQVAREKLLYDLAPLKAVNTIRESLIGCPSEIALKVLMGDILLFTDEDGVSINAVNYTKELGKKYPKLNLEEWAERKHRQILNDGNSWKECLEEFRQNIIEDGGTFNITFEYTDLVKYVLTGDLDDLMQKDDRIGFLKCTLDGIKNYIAKSLKTIDVLKWMDNTYPGTIPPHCIEEPYIIMILMSMLQNMSFGDREMDSLIAKNQSMKTELDNYIEANMWIQKELSSRITPTPIAEPKDAGWLSPEGNYYGLNGEISNLLHMQLADTLQRDGIIPKLEDGLPVAPEIWLEENGWVKLHDTHILFAGNDNAKYKLPVKPLTDIQIEKIIQYGKKRCVDGFFRIGYKYNPVSVALFSMMEKPMIAKLFMDS